MSVLQQDLTVSEQEMSKAIAQAWLSGAPEGTMIGEMRLPAKPENLMDAQISDWIEGGIDIGIGNIPASCCT